MIAHEQEQHDRWRKEKKLQWEGNGSEGNWFVLFCFFNQSRFQSGGEMSGEVWSRREYIIFRGEKCCSIVIQNAQLKIGIYRLEPHAFE
jgi:hypothetical protein